MPLENAVFGRSGSLRPIFLVVAGFLQMASQAQADSFVMTSGKVIEGTVVDGSSVSVFIKDKNGLLQSVMLADVAEVRVGLDGDEEMVGRLAGFRDGVYEIVENDSTFYVEDGRVTQTVAVQDEGAPAVIPNAGGPAIGIDTPETFSATPPETPPEPAPAAMSELLKRAPL